MLNAAISRGTDEAGPPRVRRPHDQRVGHHRRLGRLGVVADELKSLVLAAIADEVLLVVAWDHTPRSRISEALKILRPEGHRVAGIVLNKVDLTKMPRYGYEQEYPRSVAST